MHKIFTIGLFLMAINFCSFCQDYDNFYAFNQKNVRGKIDRLEKKLPALRDSARIDCLNDLSELHLSFLTDTSTIYARQALEEAEKINYIKGQAKSYRNMGRSECILIMDLPSAEKYFSKSLALYIKTNDEQQIAWAWGALGISKWVVSKFPEAMDAFENAERIFKKVGDTVDLLGAYYCMRMTEFERGHYAQSLEYTFKYNDLSGKVDYDALSNLYAAIGDDEMADKYFLKIPPPINDDRRNWQYFYNGNRYAGKKHYDSALHYYHLFSDYAKTKGAGPLIKLDESMGNLHRAQKHFDTALVFFNEALRLSTKANDRNQVMKVYLYLSETYNENGNYKEALKNARALSQIANETGAKQMIRDAHFLLYQIFAHLQKTDSAFVHLQKYTTIKDSIDRDLSQQKLAFYLIKSEREQAQSRINLLDVKTKLQQQQLKQSKQQRKILVAGLFILLLFGALVFRNILLKRKGEKHLRELAENELKIQKLESGQQQAGLQQQATTLEMQALRAQMNPHFIFNCLNAINGFILKNEAETAADYLTKFSRLIRMVLNNSQKQFISLEEELDTLALYLHMERLRFSFNYQVNCDNSVDAPSVFIPPMLLQPFVENAIWHGLMHQENGGELTVDVHLDNDMLHVKIEDNGVGRKQAALIKSKSAQKNKSLGLTITKNRMALLNQGLNDVCFFEIKDLEDGGGNPLGTSVSLKIKTQDTPVNYPANTLQQIINK